MKRDNALRCHGLQFGPCFSIVEPNMQTRHAIERLDIGDHRTTNLIDASTRECCYPWNPTQKRVRLCTGGNKNALGFILRVPEPPRAGLLFRAVFDLGGDVDRDKLVIDAKIVERTQYNQM